MPIEYVQAVDCHGLKRRCDERVPERGERDQFSASGWLGLWECIAQAIVYPRIQVLFYGKKSRYKQVYYFTGGTPVFPLNTVNNAKHPYNRPTGYATSSLCSVICSTATKMPDAAYVHQSIERMVTRYPRVASRLTTILMAETPTMGSRQ